MFGYAYGCTFYSSTYIYITLATAYRITIYVYSWLDLFFWIGYKRELQQEDLYATPEEAQSQYLLERFNK